MTRAAVKRRGGATASPVALDVQDTAAHVGRSMKAALLLGISLSLVGCDAPLKSPPPGPEDKMINVRELGVKTPLLYSEGCCDNE
jgi:hypothetical protein